MVAQQEENRILMALDREVDECPEGMTQDKLCLYRRLLIRHIAKASASASRNAVANGPCELAGSAQ